MSQLEVDKIIPQSGTTLTIGDSGDTISLPSGVSLDTLTITGDLTVDTDTLKVDSTNNRVGVKNASPTVELDVTGEAKISGDLTVDTDTLYVDSANNNVGIGTTSPSSFDAAGDNLVVGTGSGNNGITVYSGTVNAGSLFFADGTGSAAAKADGYIQYEHNNQALAIATGGGSEAMRIDSSGNLLVGKTVINNTTDGFYANSDGFGAVNTGARCATFVRNTSDGDLVEFRKDTTTVGSIGSSSGRLYIGSPQGSDSFIRFNSNEVVPSTSAGGARDDVINLGAGAARFSDAYITNGVTTGSDQNEKQSIQSLTASEIAVAQRISKLFKTFKWNSAVEKKGDNARTHTGVIAQEVQQAFADEGLDACNYGMFMSNTWWEKEISVDAVAEELDEEGNVVVEGKDAYTYIDTKDEATEGYTERTRLGIRYPELLSFVSSAFEQRLTNIETRLETLENE